MQNQELLIKAHQHNRKVEDEIKIMIYKIT